MTVFKWSKTAASNATADSSINAREGQAPSTINDAIRGVMAAVAKWRDDLSGNLVTAGTSTAYTLATNQSYTALADGISVRARLNATSGAAPTLNVDGTGAKAIASVYGTAISTGALLSGGVYEFVYDSTDDKWIVVGIVVQPIALGGTGATTAAAAATALGLGTGDSPQFTAINLGHASDTTLTRTGAGDIAVEGNGIYRAGGSDVLLADGGTGASLADPNADRIMFWDDSAGSVTWLQAGTNLAISGTTLTADAYPITRQAVQSTTSGSAIDFTGIPSYVNEVTVMLNGVSLSGTDNLLIQLGTSGGLVTSGYQQSATRLASGSSIQGSSDTSGFEVWLTVSSRAASGMMILQRMDANLWVASHSMRIASSDTGVGGGTVDLGGALTQIRVTRTGSNTFDAGSATISYR